jgi:hypothetical protein
MQARSLLLSLSLAQAIPVGSETSIPRIGVGQQSATSLAASSKFIAPNYFSGGGAGGGDTYTVVTIPSWVLEDAVRLLASGIVGYIVSVVCTTPACAYAVRAVGSTLTYLVTHTSFPTVYIWWDDTTWSYAGYSLVY